MLVSTVDDHDDGEIACSFCLRSQLSVEVGVGKDRNRDAGTKDEFLIVRRAKCYLSFFILITCFTVHVRCHCNSSLLHSILLIRVMLNRCYINRRA